MSVLIKSKNLYKEIADLRNKMIRTGLKKGLSHPDTIKASVELDKKLNIYQKVLKKSI